MKIVTSCDADSVIKIADVGVGEPFMYQAKPYMKITQYNPAGINAVNLDTGLTSQFTSQAVERLPNAKFVTGT